MGLFINKKIPEMKDKYEIDFELQMLNSYNNAITKEDNVDIFINDIKSIKNIVKKLIKYEKNIQITLIQNRQMFLKTLNPTN